MSPFTADQEGAQRSVPATLMARLESVGSAGYWLVLGAGVALMFGSELLFFAYGSAHPTIRVLELLLPMAVGIGFVWYGFQLRDHEFSSWQIAILGLAVLSGMGLFVVLATYMRVLLSLEQALPQEPLYLLLNAMALGALLNFCYAYQYLRVTRKANRLESRVDRLLRVFSRVSHDLKNPLNVAQGYADLVGGQLDESDRVGPLQDALDRINALVDELVVFAHSNHATDTSDTLSLGTVVTESWAMVETESGTLTIESDLRFEGDHDRVQHLLENLFRNAIEHGGPETTVTAGALESGGAFFVSDDGPGIPVDERDAVFEPGYTTAANGTGLGLNIVADICEAHNWSVGITDSPSGGTRFEIDGVSKPADS